MSSKPCASRSTTRRPRLIWTRSKRISTRSSWPCSVQPARPRRPRLARQLALRPPVGTSKQPRRRSLTRSPQASTAQPDRSSQTSKPCASRSTTRPRRSNSYWTRVISSPRSCRAPRPQPRRRPAARPRPPPTTTVVGRRP